MVTINVLKCLSITALAMSSPLVQVTDPNTSPPFGKHVLSSIHDSTINYLLIRICTRL